MLNANPTLPPGGEAALSAPKAPLALEDTWGDWAGTADDKLDRLIRKAHQQRSSQPASSSEPSQSSKPAEEAKHPHTDPPAFSEDNQDLPDTTEDLMAAASAFAKESKPVKKKKKKKH